MAERSEDRLEMGMVLEEVVEREVDDRRSALDRVARKAACMQQPGAGPDRQSWGSSGKPPAVSQAVGAEARGRCQS